MGQNLKSWETDLRRTFFKTSASIIRKNFFMCTAVKGHLLFKTVHDQSDFFVMYSSRVTDLPLEVYA